MICEELYNQPCLQNILESADEVKIEGYLGDKMLSCLQKRVLAQKLEPLIAPFVSRNEGPYGFRCEYWGKWFTSLCLGYKNRRDPAIREKMDEAVQALIETQGVDGYIGTYQDAERLGTWDVWGRKYVLLGLIAYYDYTSESYALDAACRQLDCLIGELKEKKISLADTGWVDWKGLPPTSILEPTMLLYERSGNAAYLEFAEAIIESWETPSTFLPKGLSLISDALKGVPVRDIGAPKAYEMMSCYEGLCDMYRISGNRRFLEPVISVAESIIDTELMVSGSGSNQEMWCRGRSIQTNLIEQPVETCVTVTWIKLCYKLLCLTKDPKWADQIEIALYNALLSAMTPGGEWWSYYSPLVGERVPSACQQADAGLSCCVASGPRALLLTPQWAVMQDDQSVYVNLYSQGRASVSLDQGQVTLEQKTLYPKEGNVVITIGMDLPLEFGLNLRIPKWSEQTKLLVNGEAIEVSPGSYARIDREWRDGDQIEIDFDFRGRVVHAGPEKNHSAILRGPILLALDNRLVVPEAKAVRVESEDGFIELEPDKEKPDEVYMAFKAQFKVLPTHVFDHHHVTLTLCDFTSAGNAWSDDNLYRVWLPQPLLLTDAFVTGVWKIMYHEATIRPEIPSSSSLGGASPAINDWDKSNSKK